jgi:hypothetical protein
MRKSKNAYSALVSNPEGLNALGSPRINVKMDLK